MLADELSGLDFDECPNLIMIKIIMSSQKSLDILFPKKKLSRKRKKLLQNPWITKEILKKMKGRDKLYRKFVKNDKILNSVHHTGYKQVHLSLIHI